jgi:hypothetical protein
MHKTHMAGKRELATRKKKMVNTSPSRSDPFPKGPKDFCRGPLRSGMRREWITNFGRYELNCLDYIRVAILARWRVRL